MVRLGKTEVLHISDCLGIDDCLIFEIQDSTLSNTGYLKVLPFSYQLLGRLWVNPPYLA